jgi:type III pantothenate kinase
MNLLIDQGNSFCKIAIHSENKIEKILKFKSINNNDLEKIITDYRPNSCILSSVKKPNKEFINSIQKINHYHILDVNSKLPIEINYSSPLTLGKDRLASAVGANCLFPNENLLIIDFGTAITYDIVIKNNTFVGGNIAPGLRTRFLSLHTETDQLPLLKATEKYSVIGDSTNSAIISGVQEGIRYEIEGYFKYMEQKYGRFKTVFTGGDASFFEKIIKTTIFVEPNLIFIGLNKILKYND